MGDIFIEMVIGFYGFGLGCFVTWQVLSYLEIRKRNLERFVNDKIQEAINEKNKSK